MREKAEKPAKRKLTRAERKQIEAVIRQAKVSHHGQRQPRLSLITITYETTVFTPEKYILPTFYYVISVRRFRSLPASVFPADIPVPLGSTSRWSPLLTVNAFYCRSCSGLAQPSCCPCWAHLKIAIRDLAAAGSLMAIVILLFLSAVAPQSRRQPAHCFAG